MSLYLCVNDAFLLLFVCGHAKRAAYQKGNVTILGTYKADRGCPWKPDADRAPNQRYTFKITSPFVNPQIMLICGQCCDVVWAKDVPDIDMKEMIRCSKYSVKN